MNVYDAIVVGGGPAGSSCAWKLKEAGLDVLVLDRQSFPRLKLCAGWVTPQALQDLELDPYDYPLSFLTFEKLHLHWKMLSVKLASRQHSVRRYEFDDFLLRRSGARVFQHKVRDIQRDGGTFVIDGKFRCEYLIGAGGTACPVYRGLFHQLNPRSSILQTATFEHEFAYDWDNGECHLWFFEDGLPGYAWYVPKGDGYVNVGLGGMADQLKQQHGRIQDYWHKFVSRLRDRGFVTYDAYAPIGYSYFLRGDIDVVEDNKAYLVGDAIGLATRDMCEGIGPAVQSGLLAARSIVTGEPYSVAAISKFSGGGIASKILERKFVGQAATEALAKEAA